MQNGMRVWSFAGLSVAVIMLTGCGAENQSPVGTSAATGDLTAGAPRELPDPARAVYAFLDAARTGNDAKAAALLTPLARTKTAKLGASVAPPSSDTAQFELGEVQYLAPDGARVPSIWSDLNGDGRRASYQMLWMVRKASEGWRVAGVAAEVFKGEPPMVLNFENPEEVVAQQKMLKEERRRRAERAGQMQQSENTKDSIQR